MMGVIEQLNGMIRRMPRAAERRAWVELVAWMKEQERINREVAGIFSSMSVVELDPAKVVDIPVDPLFEGEAIDPPLPTEGVAASEIVAGEITSENISVGSVEGPVVMGEAVDHNKDYIPVGNCEEQQEHVFPPIDPPFPAADDEATEDIMDTFEDEHCEGSGE